MAKNLHIKTILPLTIFMELRRQGGDKKKEMLRVCFAFRKDCPELDMQDGYLNLGLENIHIILENVEDYISSEVSIITYNHVWRLS